MKSAMKKGMLAATAVSAFALSGVSLAGSGGSSDPWASSTYTSRGSSTVSTSGSTSSCTIRRGGSGNPIIIWGNGTGSSPSDYDSGLRHWASHGFTVAAATTSNAGTGSEMLACISAGANAGGDASRVGASGHSQGGGGTIMAGRDSRVDATAPIQPYTIGLGHQSSSQSQQRGPMLLLTGSDDSIASPSTNAEPVFSRANVAVFWAERTGADHFEPAGDFGDFRGITTAWFRYKLKNDSTAGNTFRNNSCSSCTKGSWRIRVKGTI